jgi:hypothetical protein
MKREILKNERCRYKNGDMLDNRRNNLELLTHRAYTKENGVIKMPLSNGTIAILDKADEDLCKILWSTSSYGYAIRNENKKMVILHRIILERTLGRVLLPTEFCDHANGDILNRRCNLRLATRNQNNANRRKKVKTATSQYYGVSWHKASQKWKASIKYEGNYHYIGIFSSEIEAAKQYDKYAKDIHGEFATLNFP